MEIPSPSEMPSIIFENEHIVAVAKPAWWLSHPSNEARHIKTDIMTWTRDQLGHYVYPLHRLDLQTSGVLILAKTKADLTLYQQAWPETTKEYYCLAHGDLPDHGRFQFALTINGQPKDCLTEYTTLTRFKDASYCHITLKTGRYHQIRRHFSRRMHALLGDRKYGKKKWNDHYQQQYQLNRLFLHCASIKHPLITEDIKMPLPSDLQACLDILYKEHE